MLVGRQVEIDRLADRILGDHPVVLLGEPGIGKTALARAALEATGLPWREGGALATLRWVPYLPIARALGERRVSGDTAAVARRLRGVLGERGVLLLDDIGWADPGTLEVLELVAGTVPTVLTLRTGDPSTETLLERLVSGGHEAVHLEPLTDDAAAELVLRERGDLGRTAVERLVRRCAGNPLMLLQLAGPSGDASESLRLAIAGRLRLLSAPAVRLFGLAALAGRPMEVASSDREAAGELDRAGLVHVVDRELSVLHQLIADQAIARLSADERVSMHRTLAEAADDDGEAARHWEDANEPAQARRHALLAAEATEAPAERAAHLAIAARCSSGPEADGLRLRAAAGLALALRHDEAEELLAAVEGLDPATRAEVEIIRTRTRWYAGDDEGFRVAIERALAAGAEVGGAMEARALVERSRETIFLEAEPGARAIEQADQGLQAASAAGVPTARAQMLAGLARYMANEPGWPALLAGAMASARESGDVDTELLAANNLITANESSGDPRAARALAAQMVARASSLSLIGWEIQFRAMRLNLDLHAADYLPAIAEAIELLDEPIDARARAQVETSLAFCLIDVGRVDLAARRLTELETDPLGEVIGVSTIRWLQAEAELNGGRPRRARDLAREAMADASVPGFPRIVERLAVWELGEDAGAALGEDGTPLLAGIHPESIGLLAATRGKALEAVAAFDEAAVLWAPYHRRGALRCRWLAAELARAAGDVSSSRERLLELEPELIERGMTPLLRRVHRSLRAVGERRTASRGPSPAGELSARQREVMGLVASGLTNGEIARRLGISRATVVEQVGAAMALLGASTRGQAAVLATS